MLRFLMMLLLQPNIINIVDEVSVVIFAHFLQNKHFQKKRSKMCHHVCPATG